MFAKLNEWGQEISLVPDSGTQFVDFAFDLQEHRQLTRTFIERPSKQADGQEHLQLLRVPDLKDDETMPPQFEARPNDRMMDVDGRLALEVFLEKWIPVPFLRVRDGADWDQSIAFDAGPSNWARVRIVEIPDRVGSDGPSHRVVFAFDTAIEEQAPNRPYVAPAKDDVVSPTVFRMASDAGKIGWFFSDTRTPDERETSAWFQQWVDDWLMESYAEYMRVRYPKTEFRIEDMEYRLEHWIRYVALLETLQAAICPPRVKFIDTISRSDDQSRPRTSEVSVDLVLDVGNSRTCGLLIESYPNGTQIDLNNALVLQLRDLQRPENVYSDPFSSHVELSQGRFGRNDLSRRSSRRSAFAWPSLVRVGPEALRMRSENDGTGADTGMSSPKRYLWDVDQVETPWEFQARDYSLDRRPPSIEVQARQRLNAKGEVISQLRADRARRPAADFEPARTLTFSRSSFFSLMLGEIVMQALCMANSVGVRHGRQMKDHPRRIKRIVLTLPPATTLQEQQIMKTRAEAALRMVWSLMGWEDMDGNAIAGEAGLSYPVRPSIRLNLDEASCTQFVWLYGEIAQKFAGAAEEYAQLFGKSRPFVEPEQMVTDLSDPKSSIRVASIDIGGGTTDLMVTTYYVEENRALKPTQNFREGFRIAGDDLLRGVIEQMIFPAIAEHLTQCGARNAQEVLSRAFGGDRPDISVQDKQRRRQFTLTVLQVAGVSILSAHEAKGRFSDDEIDVQKIGQLMGENTVKLLVAGERPASDRLLSYLEDDARANGAVDFRIEDVDVPLDFRQLRVIADNVLGEIADQLSEAIAQFDVDMILLSGRPTRLPAIADMFIARLAAPPEAILPLSDYPTDTWFPFRTGDNQRIADPKTCTSVGGMLCLLAERQIENFTLFTNRLSMRSTARFIGPIESGGQLKADKVLFSDVDLDDKANAGADEKALDYYARMRLGFRQLDLERWTTTPLYRLEFLANDNFTPGSLPFALTLSREEFTADPEITDPDIVMRSQAGREAFKITRAEDAHGKPRQHKTEFRLSLCTLPNDTGYWLDTGIFSLN